MEDNAMMPPDSARDYDERGSAAAYSVLIELGQVLGAYSKDQLVEQPAIGLFAMLGWEKLARVWQAALKDVLA